jgi:hypothetical protein
MVFAHPTIVGAGFKSALPCWFWAKSMPDVTLSNPIPTPALPLKGREQEPARFMRCGWRVSVMDNLPGGFFVP